MQPVNPNASLEAKQLLEYLYSIRGKKIITGQHTQTHPMEEITYIKGVTENEPLLRGFEMLSYSPNINYQDASDECLIEIQENKGTLLRALEWGKKGIVTLSFHWFSPLYGRDKSFYAKNTPFDASKILVESAERKAFYSDLDYIALELQKFQDAHIPILWRPFHESDGTWFWWGAKGSYVASCIYKLMYHYFVDIKHLDNLIWVWNCRNKEGYPGDEYVDINSVDIYLRKKRSTDYAKAYYSLVKNTSRDKLVALGEVGYNPDIQKLSQSSIPWVYYMTWSKEFCIGEKYNTKEELIKLYDSSYSIKL